MIDPSIDTPAHAGPGQSAVQPPATGGSSWWVWIVCLGITSGGVWWWKKHPPGSTPAAGAPGAASGGKPGAAGGGGGRPGGPGGRGSGAVTVGTATAEKRDFEQWLTTMGTVVPLQSVGVRSRVDGPVQKIHFAEGQNVKAGDLLVEIDARPFEVQLQQAKAQLARDEVQRDNVLMDLKRYEALLAKNSIARQQVETQQALAGQWEATVKSDRAQVATAELTLAYCRLEAPIDGQIGFKTIDQGALARASATEPLLTITQMNPMGVIGSIPQAAAEPVLQLLRAKKDVPVEVLSRETNLPLASGLLACTDNQIDATTGALRFKAEFPNSDRRLFPQQFVTLRVLTSVTPGQTLIPTAAVQRGAQGAFTYVVQADNTVTLRPVVIAGQAEQLVAVKEGVAAGEVVVVDGVDKLREGAKVTRAGLDPKAAGPRR